MFMSNPNAIQNRYEFVMLYDVKNGNPNGDPDNDNMPRMNISNDHGIVSDVCIKRKIRDEIARQHYGEPGYRIYVTSEGTLNAKEEESYTATNYEERAKSKDSAEKTKAGEDVVQWLCDEYYDIRTFGAVLTTVKSKKVKGADSVRGPVQIEFSESIDPIEIQTVTLTRTAITKEADAEKKSTEMGHKHIIPFALYRCHGYISAYQAQKWGFSETDLTALFDAIKSMFENDHSASRGEMNLRELIVFKHRSISGNAPSHKLFDKVKVTRTCDPEEPATRFEDYTVTVDTDIPDGVEMTRM